MHEIRTGHTHNIRWKHLKHTHTRGNGDIIISEGRGVLVVSNKKRFLYHQRPTLKVGAYSSSLSHLYFL